MRAPTVELGILVDISGPIDLEVRRVTAGFQHLARALRRRGAGVMDDHELRSFAFRQLAEISQILFIYLHAYPLDEVLYSHRLFVHQAVFREAIHSQGLFR